MIQWAWLVYVATAGCVWGAETSPADGPTQMLLHCDFDTDAWLPQWGVPEAPERTQLVQADPEQKFQPLRASALRVHVEQGGHYGLSLAFPFKKHLGYEPEEVYFRLENNRWYCIEQHVKLNTPGQSDGVLRGWVDGRLAFERMFVHAHDRAVGIVGFFVRFQHFLHVGDKLAVGVGRDHPVLDFPLGHTVFFSVCRTVSGLIDSTISSSTI